MEILQKIIDIINSNFDENNTINDIKTINHEYDYDYIIMKNGDGYILYPDDTIYFDCNENE